MSILITKTGIPVNPIIQGVLASDSRLEVAGGVFASCVCAVLNVAITPLHELALAGRDIVCLNGVDALVHLGNVVLSPVKNALLATVLAVTFVASLIFKAKAVAFGFDGEHAIKLKKYELVLSEYRKVVNEFDATVNALKGEYRHSPIAKDLLLCLECLKESSDPRENYQRFVRHLDRVATWVLEHKDDPNLSHANSQCILLAENLAMARWSGVSMKEYFGERVEHAVGTSPKPQNIQELHDRLQTGNKAVGKSSPSARKCWFSLNLQKLRGSLGVENFTGLRNTPNRLARVQYEGMDHGVVHLRHGSPTRGKIHPFHRESEGIVPNYELFLVAAAKRGESVFYAIHQRLTPNPIDDESPRTKAIYALQEKHANFHAIVQPVEGEFFNRKRGSVEELKDALRREFFTEGTTALLPNGLAEDVEYQARFEELMNVVHEVFFKDKEVLSQDDWKNFILFFYVIQRMDLRNRFSSTYSVTACKDDLDRGGGQGLLELTLTLILSNREEEVEDLSSIVSHTLGPPLVVKQIPMVQSRLNPILCALRHITSNPDVTQALRSNKVISEMKPTSIKFD